MSAEFPASGPFEGRVHLSPIRIYYEDTDFTGLVYHANYLRFFERGRSNFLRAAGIDHTALLALDTAFTILSLNVKFLKPARIDDALLVRTAFDAIVGARLFATQALERAGERVAEARVEIACISLAGRAKRLPALLVDKIKPYLVG